MVVAGVVDDHHHFASGLAADAFEFAQKAQQVCASNMPSGRDITSLPSLRRTAPKKLMLFRVGAWRQIGSSTSGGTHMRQREPCCWK